MQAIAHDKNFSKKVGVSTEVGKEFNDADQANKKTNNKIKPKHSRLYKDQ